MFLNFSDIHTTYPFGKILHCHLKPYIVKKPISYCLKILSELQKLHLVFHIVKLTPALNDPISNKHSILSLNSIIINGKGEWEIEKILNSCWHCQRYQYLIKWKKFSLEANSWKNTTDVFVLNKVVEFHCLNLWALRFIWVVEF